MHTHFQGALCVLKKKILIFAKNIHFPHMKVVYMKLKAGLKVNLDSNCKEGVRSRELDVNSLT